jgi:hypothetical protein
MAYEVNVGQDFSYFGASADLSANQFYFVVLNSSKQLAVAGANVSCLGVLQDTPAAAGRSGEVRCFGVTKVVAGGTIAVNDKIASDANGKAVKATAASVSAGTPEPLAGSYVMGLALEAASAGETFSMLLTHAGLTN